MHLKGIYWTLFSLLLAILSILTWRLITDNTALFFVVESLILCTFILLWQFYRKVVKPLRKIGNGMDLLKEQDFSSRLSHVGEFEADRIVDIFNRMMEQLRKERLHVREQNQLLDLLINASPLGVIMMGDNQEIRSLNPAARKLIGEELSETLEGKKWEDIHTELADGLASLPVNETRTVRLSNSGIYRCSHLTFMNQGYNHPFFLIESLTSEVMKAEKKAYEKVIRMIAHEVNNTTAGITSTLDTVNQTLAEMEQTEEIRQVTQVCIDRCYNMSRFITNFANVVKIPEPQLKPVNLNNLLSSCKRFMESLCQGRDIRLHLRLCDAPLVVRIDASLFEQVIVNAIKNSVESIGQDGDIYITTTSTPACMEIADTGTGISKETESKLFSPFFSTKPNGQGIGLVFIREVLFKHRCAFSLKTYPDGLTRFKIQFTDGGGN